MNGNIFTDALFQINLYGLVNKENEWVSMWVSEVGREGKKEGAELRATIA